MQPVERISSIIRRLRDRLSALELDTKLEGSLLEVQKGEARIVVDGKEHTGPVTLREFDLWLQDLPAYSQAILIAMGFFRPEVHRRVLSDPAIRSKLVLISFGLRDYMDTVLKPKRLLVAEITEPVAELLSILEETGIHPEDVSCDYCPSKALVACSVCGLLLCKRHFIPCPVCKAIMCHSTETRRHCFFKHACR